MKRYLYEITANGLATSIPCMPKVLAEKTAKMLERSANPATFGTRKTAYTTTDASPAGAHDWFAYYYG